MIGPERAGGAGGGGYDGEERLTVSADRARSVTALSMHRRPLPPGRPSSTVLDSLPNANWAPGGGGSTLTAKMLLSGGGWALLLLRLCRSPTLAA